MSNNVYSKHFVSEVKRLFPNNATMHEAAGKNEKQHLGTLLTPANNGCIMPEQILNCKTIDEAHAIASEVRNKLYLHNLWYDEVKHWH